MCIQSVLHRAQPFSLAATPGPWEGSCQHQDEDEVDVAVEGNHDEDDGWTMDRSPIIGVITITMSSVRAICHRHKHTGRITIIFINNYFQYELLSPQAEGGD